MDVTDMFPSLVGGENIPIISATGKPECVFPFALFYRLPQVRKDFKDAACGLLFHRFKDRCHRINLISRPYDGMDMFGHYDVSPDIE